MSPEIKSSGNIKTEKYHSDIAQTSQFHHEEDNFAITVNSGRSRIERQAGQAMPQNSILERIGH